MKERRRWKHRSRQMPRFEYELWGAKMLCKRGSDLPHAKLNEDLVREIRANRRGLTAKQQAEIYGVHYRTIESVRSGERWGHVR